MEPRHAVLIMGPTASGKTGVAIELAKRYPCDLISVDSALVYRGMDIGTAKPTREELQAAPHQLIDIREPSESYSAGDFVRDAKRAMQSSFEQGRLPVLVGGTMMYFRALTRGIAKLPRADHAIRAQIDADAKARGWPALHDELRQVDAETAARLQPRDAQRIQRALEVYRSSGKALSEWQREDTGALDTATADDTRYTKIALRIEPRSLLHQRIETRLDAMIASGFEEEMRGLYARDDLTAESPAMRAVGYRQFWQYLDGELSLDEARNRALFATRQLAKRQLTWLRSEPNIFWVDALEAKSFDTISKHLTASGCDRLFERLG